ncbi:MAG: alpha/beta hydrolase [Opitutaceae bacterium]
MSRPIVIVHGWSDKSSSFTALKNFVASLGDGELYEINLADYVTLDDTVRFDDLVAGMDRAWTEAELPRKAHTVDVVTHSTGALVVRDWMTQHFAPEETPIKRLAMLAPANFGSPLAHKGRSFFGRIIKGFDGERLFETGTQILKGLELASPYSWQLALRDRFSNRNYYGPGRVLCTVLVGNTGYDGIKGAANEEGSDGTVRISTANMNCDLVEADFATDPQKPVFKIFASTGRTAMRILERDNHSTAAFKDGGPNDPAGRELLRQALTVTDDGFEAWCDACEADNQTIPTDDDHRGDEYFNGYLNLVTHLQDDAGVGVTDYFMEFYAEDEDDNVDRLAGLFHRDVIRTVHAYGDNKAYRSFLIDCTTLHRDIGDLDEHLKISLTAVPEFGRDRVVGYRTFSDDDIGGIKIDRAKLERIFRPHRTVLVDLKIHRERSPRVFTIKEA